MKVTIRDVAKQCGHSLSTVSRVINNSPFVSEKTRTEVMAIIEEMGFRPNSVARSLVTGRMNIVACIIGDRWNPFYAELFSAAEVVLNQADYMAVLCYSDYDSDKEEKYLEAANKNNFAGVIMVTAPETKKLIENLTSIKCPVVLTNRYLISFPTDVVLVDNYYGGYIATRHLIDMGHQHIAHLAGPENSTASCDRLKGYREAMRVAGLVVREEDITHANLSEQEGYRFGRDLLDNPRDVTAVFCANDMLVSGVVKAYEQCHKLIPEDLSIVGFDDSPVATRGPVQLTTVRQDTTEMGKAAAEMMLNRIANHKSPYCRKVFTPVLVVRDSVIQCKPLSDGVKKPSESSFHL